MPFINVFEKTSDGTLRYGLSSPFDTKEAAKKAVEALKFKSIDATPFGIFKEVVELHIPVEIYTATYLRTTFIASPRYDQFKNQNLEYGAKNEAKPSGPSMRK